MKSKGVEVKPIITIDGSHEVNMVYFDDVKVPKNNLIGDEGQGWNIAKFLLMHERTGIAGIAALKRELKSWSQLHLQFQATRFLTSLIIDAGTRITSSSICTNH